MGVVKTLPYTHTVVVGDSLTSLCKQVYNNANYAVQVAQYNGLNKFRDLKPGAQLVFPPLIELDNTAEG